MRQISTILASLVLTFLAALPIQAQTETSAFYIYQNDGHFDGFFYGQVQRISYSKVDTLGIEHNDYVSQEIVTEDSTYRIMLIAIDSVSFVQQEIIINPRVRILERDGLMPYMSPMSATTTGHCLSQTTYQKPCGPPFSRSTRRRCDLYSINRDKER